MKNLILLISFFSVYLVEAQENDIKQKTIDVSSYLALGWSQFRTTPSAPSDFPTFEFRLGPAVTIPVSSKFEISSRFLFGAKLKREAYNKQGQGYTIPPPFLELDEVASSRNHYFIEIPLIFQFNLPNPKLSIYAGGNYRFWMPNNSDVDFLTNRGEFDLLMGISYPIANKFKVGGEYFFGVTKVYNSSGTIDGIDSDLRVSNTAFQLYVQYKLK